MNVVLFININRNLQWTVEWKNYRVLLNRVNTLLLKNSSPYFGPSNRIKDPPSNRIKDRTRKTNLFSTIFENHWNTYHNTKRLKNRILYCLICSLWVSSTCRQKETVRCGRCQVVVLPLRCVSLYKEKNFLTKGRHYSYVSIHLLFDFPYDFT